jgi:hypothetical protein
VIRVYISAEKRRRVIEAFRNRCAYCLTSAEIIGPFLEIDHIIPVSRGGSSEEENLALSCPNCNVYKSDQIDGVDPNTGDRVRLFHPRQQQWKEHFSWSEDGIWVIGKTPEGRATIATLNMNEPHLRASRRRWVAVGWHPPAE